MLSIWGPDADATDLCIVQTRKAFVLPTIGIVCYRSSRLLRGVPTVLYPFVL